MPEDMDATAQMDMADTLAEVLLDAVEVHADPHALLVRLDRRLRHLYQSLQLLPLRLPRGRRRVAALLLNVGELRAARDEPLLGGAH